MYKLSPCRDRPHPLYISDLTCTSEIVRACNCRTRAIGCTTLAAKTQFATSRGGSLDRSDPAAWMAQFELIETEF
jgi:hypothetical protein